jgi:glycosyltransferase involved in cell wall biosynthesis
MISIIIPVYNAEKSIEITVNSVLDQTYKNFELIIVDDGSSDGSDIVTKKLVEKYNFIKYYYQKNSGVTAARKKGYFESAGDFIMFLDADDKLKHNCLEVLMAQFKEGIDMVNGSVLGIPDGRLWIHKEIGVLSQIQAVESILNSTTYGYLYASLYRRQVLQNDVFDVDATIKIGEDVLMKLLMCKYVDKVCNISDILYEYINNEGSVMNNKIIHPDYYERYIAVRSRILDSFENKIELTTLTDKMTTADANKMVSHFFSPFINFDEKTFLKVNLYKVHSNLKESHLLSNRSLTILYKFGKRWIYKIKNLVFLKRKNYQVIY